MLESPLNSGSVQVILAFITVTLASVVVFMYKENRRIDRERINDLKEYTSKATGLFDSYTKQQELWLEKLLSLKGGK